MHLNRNYLVTKNKALTVLTLVTASMSIISLIQKLLNVSLGAVAASYVSYYRKISYFFFGTPAELFHIQLPISLIDFWAISFICAGAYVRTENLERARAFRDYNFASSSIKLRLAIFFIWGFTGVGLFIPLSVLSVGTYTENDITRAALIHFGIISMISVFFYAVNAFAPSV